jgi:hypothetical protein
MIFIFIIMLFAMVLVFMIFLGFINWLVVIILGFMIGLMIFKVLIIRFTYDWWDYVVYMIGYVFE